MKAGTTGIVMGAAVGVIGFILYLCALVFSVQSIPDAQSLLLGLQLATGIGAATGGWIGVLIALLSPRARELSAPTDEPEPTIVETGSEATVPGPRDLHYGWLTRTLPTSFGPGKLPSR